MKLLSMVVCCIAITCSTAYSQGYNWEWSPRLPLAMPIRYVGVEVSAGFALHKADLLYSEQYLPCCTLSKGTGVPVATMLYAEEWTKPWLAFTVSAGISYQSVNLSAPGDTLPQIGPDDVVRTVVTEWQLQTSMTYISLATGARARLFGSHATVGFQLRGNLSAGSSNAVLSEHILQPSDYFFNVQGRQVKERTVDSTNFGQRSSFYLEPTFSIQYDVPLTIGYVLTPLVQVAMPLTSLSTASDWRYYSLMLGVRLSKGL